MSCGLDADGVVDGEIINDEGIWDNTFVDVKFLNIAKIESALDTFGLMRRIVLRSPTSLMVNSEPDSDSLPWFEHGPCGERESFALGVGGTELGRGINSVDDATGKLSALRFEVLCKSQNNTFINRPSNLNEVAFEFGMKAIIFFQKFFLFTLNWIEFFFAGVEAIWIHLDSI